MYAQHRAIGYDWFKAALTGDPNHRPRAFPSIPGTSETVDPFGSFVSAEVLVQDQKTPKMAGVASHHPVSIPSLGFSI